MAGGSPLSLKVNEQDRKLTLHKQEATRPAGGGVQWGMLPWLLCTKHGPAAGWGHQTETWTPLRSGEEAPRTGGGAGSSRWHPTVLGDRQVPALRRRQLGRVQGACGGHRKFRVWGQ